MTEADGSTGQSACAWLKRRIGAPHLGPRALARTLEPLTRKGAQGDLRRPVREGLRFEKGRGLRLALGLAIEIIIQLTSEAFAQIFRRAGQELAGHRAGGSRLT